MSKEESLDTQVIKIFNMGTGDIPRGFFKECLNAFRHPFHSKSRYMKDRINEGKTLIEDDKIYLLIENIKNPDPYDQKRNYSFGFVFDIVFKGKHVPSLEFRSTLEYNEIPDLIEKNLKEINLNGRKVEVVTKTYNPDKYSNLTWEIAYDDSDMPKRGLFEKSSTDGPTHIKFLEPKGAYFSRAIKSRKSIVLSSDKEIRKGSKVYVINGNVRFEFEAVSEVEKTKYPVEVISQTNCAAVEHKLKLEYKGYVEQKGGFNSNIENPPYFREKRPEHVFASK